MSQIISAVLIVGGTGLLFGCILAFASFIFKVEEDERIELISNELPGANCGGCGYAGCSAYASAVAEGKAPVNACSVGKDAVAKKIASIMGTSAEEAEPMCARVLCSGTCTVAKDKYEYSGIGDCIAQNKLAGGAKACAYGCLGLGSCVSVCQFDAISVIDGIAVVNEEKCVACGKCIDKCPKNIITLVPKKAKYTVTCASHDVGKKVIGVCSEGCIGCGICAKNCPRNAIILENHLAAIDYGLCIACGLCAEKCPKKTIKIYN